MTALGGCRSWWLPIKLPCTHYPTPQAHNHVELNQSISISMADLGCSSSSGSGAADDLGSGQQGGSSLRTLESIQSSYFCHTCMYVYPCVSCDSIKIVIVLAFRFARVHPAWSSSCFTNVCQGGIWSYLLHAYLCFPGWDLYDLRYLDYLLFSGVICMICGI